jgi:hypothetical protein
MIPPSPPENRPTYLQIDSPAPKLIVCRRTTPAIRAKANFSMAHAFHMLRARVDNFGLLLTGSSKFLASLCGCHLNSLASVARSMGLTPQHIPLSSLSTSLALTRIYRSLSAVIRLDRPRQQASYFLVCTRFRFPRSLSSSLSIRY